MVSMETKMTEVPELDGAEAEGNVGKSLAWIAVAGLATVFTAGAIVGVIAAATEDGKALSATAIAIIAALVAIIGALIYTQWNLARRIRIAWFWHTRAIDEQEAEAYRDGGYCAAYAYLIGAPTWWFLWRGGLLPEPNGVLIFSAFAIIWSVVWCWKKYR